MNTREIDLVLMSDARCASVYGGALARDVFVDLYPASSRDVFVVNTDAPDQPREHWVVVWRRSANDVAFFDSYGLDASLYPDISRGFASPLVAVTSTSARLQDPGTDVCGDYCVAYCMAVARGVSPDEFIAYWLRRDDEDVRTLVGGELEESLLRSARRRVERR